MKEVTVKKQKDIAAKNVNVIPNTAQNNAIKQPQKKEADEIEDMLANL